MDFNIKNLDIKVRGNDKKDIFTIFMIVVAINVIMTILVFIFASKEWLKTIILYVVSAIYVGINIYIIKKENNISIANSKKEFTNKYDPILTKFLIKNEFILDNQLLNAEIYYMINKGYIEIDNENNVLRLKDRNLFKQIDALERIDRSKIEGYSTKNIPSYESMFIGKILFAFHNEIDINEFKKNQKDNYYLQRGEMCKLAMEKMILFEIEKNNMMGTQASNLNLVSIAGILNIITSIMLFITIGRFNFILLLTAIINIALNAVVIKNENILSYKYSEEVVKYIDNLFEYVDILKRENNSNNSISIKPNINISGIANMEYQTNEKLHNIGDNNSNLEEQTEYEDDVKTDIMHQRDIDGELKLLFGITENVIF